MYLYLIRGSVGAQALFLPIRRRIKKKESYKKKKEFGPTAFQFGIPRITPIMSSMVQLQAMVPKAVVGIGW